MAGLGQQDKYKPGEVAWGAEHHILPIFVYRRNIIALGLLMGLTIWASTWPIPNNPLGIPIAATAVKNLIAMSIAIVKACLVIMFFMHVRYSTSLTRFWAIIGFVWM